MRKLFLYIFLAIFLIPLIFLPTIFSPENKISFGVENEHKYAIQEGRFRKSTMYQFQTELSQTIEGLEQKTGNIEAMNQSLELRINMIAAEMNRLSSEYAQIKAKQFALAENNTRLEKMVISLDAANKMLASNKASAGVAPERPKTVIKTDETAKAVQKKTSIKPKDHAQAPTDKKVSVSEVEKREEAPLLKSSEPAVLTEKISKKKDGETARDLDVVKINEKGIEYGKIGMYDEAIKEFQQVISASPNIANAHYNLGLAYQKKGMLSEADREFAEYERLNKQGN